jgi:hypothetical protein
MIRIPPEHWDQVWSTLVAAGPISRVSQDPVYQVSDDQVQLLTNKKLPFEVLNGAAQAHTPKRPKV